LKQSELIIDNEAKPRLLNLSSNIQSLQHFIQSYSGTKKISFIALINRLTLLAKRTI